MAFEDANEKAFQGGDTEPDTAKEIQTRNEAIQDLTDKQRAAAVAAAEAHQQQIQDGLDAEQAVAEAGVLTTAPALAGEPKVAAKAPAKKG